MQVESSSDFYSYINMIQSYQNDELQNESIIQLLQFFLPIFFVIAALYSCYQQVRFYFIIADRFKMNINFLYLLITAYASMRVAHIGLNEFFEVSKDLNNVFSLSPLIIGVAALSIILVSWAELYSIVTGQHYKQVHTCQNIAKIINVILACSSIILYRIHPSYCLIPIFITTVGLLYAFYQYGYTNVHLIKISKSSPRAITFPQFTQTSLYACMLLVGLITILGLCNFTDCSTDLNANITSLLFDILFVFSLFYLTDCLTSSSTIDIPSKFSKDWFTAIFREKNVIRHSNAVESIENEKTLTGGCHSFVRKVDLTFQERLESPNLPKSVVVKILSWEHSLLKKTNLHIRSFLPIRFENKEVNYLKSYDIESKFYAQVAPEIRGIKLPRVFYNFDDKFNNKFGMIMEDISNQQSIPLSNGQPQGFVTSETKVILESLANFHSWFWNHPDLNRFTVWENGGYYTAEKRIEFKNKVETHWEKVIEKFTNDKIMNFDDENLISLGSRLFNIREVLLSIYSKNKCFTLVHGDFKISNLFVDQKTRHSSPRSRNYNTTLDQSQPSVFVIDWQWVGLGSPALDLSYYLATSTSVDDLDYQRMEKYVQYYHSILLSNGIVGYSYDQMWKEFRLFFIDFIVYVICCKWTAMKLEDFESNQEGLKDGLHIRSLPHVRALILLVNQFLDSLSL